MIANKPKPLPEELAGCMAKLERAKETLYDLGSEIEAYFAQEPYALTKEHRDGDLEYAFVAILRQSAPQRLAVIAGEVIHHLRSVLDHLVWALVIKAGGSPTRKHQFPICDTADKFQKACNDRMLKGISPSAQKIVRDLQPFTGGKPHQSIFYVMHEFDIADKHRLLLIVTTVGKLDQEIVVDWDPDIAEQTGRTGQTPVIVGLGDPSPKRITSDGTVVFTIRLEEPAPHFKADAKLVPHLAFEHDSSSRPLPVITLLEGMHAATTKALHRFVGEF